MASFELNLNIQFEEFPIKAYDRIRNLSVILSNWLAKDSKGKWRHLGLQSSIQKTVEAGFFTKHEIEYQLESILSQFTLDHSDALLIWAKRTWDTLSNSETIRAKYSVTGWIDSRQKQPTVLCLHAGNIPLAGFQDAIVVLMAGFRYRGKLSRKDPWLLASLLEELEKNGFAIDSYSTDLKELKRETVPEALFFSGSESTINRITSLLEEYGQFNTAMEQFWLTRYASGSVAIIESKGLFSEDPSENAIEDLLFACSMYSGRGCRSVSTILSDISLKEALPSLERAGKYFKIEDLFSWSEREHPTELIRVEAAYGIAKERTQFQFGSVLIVDEPGWSTKPGIIHWIQSDLNGTIRYLLHHRNKIQSIYLSDRNTLSSQTNESQYQDHLEEAGFKPEKLSSSQKPSLDWKPDQVDPFEWLLRQHLIPFFLF